MIRQVLRNLLNLFRNWNPRIGGIFDVWPKPVPIHDRSESIASYWKAVGGYISKAEREYEKFQ